MFVISCFVCCFVYGDLEIEEGDFKYFCCGFGFLEYFGCEIVFGYIFD